MNKDHNLFVPFTDLRTHLPVDEDDLYLETTGPPIGGLYRKV